MSQNFPKLFYLRVCTISWIKDFSQILEELVCHLVKVSYETMFLRSDLKNLEFDSYTDPFKVSYRQALQIPRCTDVPSTFVNVLFKSKIFYTRAAFSYQVYCTVICCR
jgi:hypothetical protein